MVQVRLSRLIDRWYLSALITQWSLISIKSKLGGTKIIKFLIS